MAVSPFPETHWSRILLARSDGQEEALRHIVRAYNTPIVSFLRRRGLSPEDSEDVAQEVFVQLCESEVLQRADKSKGRFRSLLLQITKHVMGTRLRHETAQKRGGGMKRVPLDDLILPAALEEPGDEDFNHEWAKNIVRRAMDKLNQECDALSKPFHTALNLHLQENLTYRQIAERMGKPTTAVAYYIRQAKARLTLLISEEVEDYCSSTEEFHDELEALSDFLFDKTG